MEQETNSGEWVECVVNPNYEIQVLYPYRLRNKKTKQLIKERRRRRTGYTDVRLADKHYRKHRIIAIQWIPNEDPIHKTCIDHINHKRSDNHLSNLRWVSTSENMRNMSSHRGRKYVFLQQLPPTAELLEHYNNHEFNGLFIDRVQKKLYIWNGCCYRELVATNDKGWICYCVQDIDRKHCKLCHNRLFGSDESINDELDEQEEAEEPLEQDETDTLEEEDIA